MLKFAELKLQNARINNAKISKYSIKIRNCLIPNAFKLIKPMISLSAINNIYTVCMLANTVFLQNQLKTHKHFSVFGNIMTNVHSRLLLNKVMKSALT